MDLRPEHERHGPVVSNSEAKRIRAQRHNAMIDRKGYGVHGPRLVAGPFKGNRAQQRAALFSQGGKKTSRSRPLQPTRTDEGPGRGLEKIQALTARAL